jgi:hypothetical protein
MRMEKLFPMIAAILVAGLFTSFADAQPWRNWQGSGGWGMGSPYQRMYDPAAVITVTGEVESVQETVPMRGMMSGIHLNLKTAGGELPVHLGPAWYVERLDTPIEVGDKIEVKGSRVSSTGRRP